MFPRGGRLCKPTPQTPVPTARAGRTPAFNWCKHTSATHLVGGRIQTSAPRVLAIWGPGEMYVFNILLGVCVRAWSLEMEEEEVTSLGLPVWSTKSKIRFLKYVRLHETLEWFVGKCYKKTWMHCVNCETPASQPIMKQGGGQVESVEGLQTSLTYRKRQHSPN